MLAKSRININKTIGKWEHIQNDKLIFNLKVIIDKKGTCYIMIMLMYIAIFENEIIEWTTLRQIKKER